MINLLVCINDKYVFPCINMISSVYKGSSDKNISVYVMTSNMSSKQKKYFNSVLNKYNIIVYYLDIPNNHSNYINRSHYSIDMYFRLFAFAFLPNNIDKILYIDADIIFKKDVNELYKLEMKDKCIAGVVDFGISKEKNYWVKNNNYYLNSGLILMNLNKIRNKYIFDDVEKIIMDYSQKLVYPDQDVLNILYDSDDVIVIDETWNYQLSKDNLNKYSEAVFHYVGCWKPWNHFIMNKYERAYWENLRHFKLYRIYIFEKFQRVFYPFKKLVIRFFRKCRCK